MSKMAVTILAKAAATGANVLATRVVMVVATVATTDAIVAMAVVIEKKFSWAALT